MFCCKEIDKTFSDTRMDCQATKNEDTIDIIHLVCTEWIDIHCKKTSGLLYAFWYFYTFFTKIIVLLSCLFMGINILYQNTEHTSKFL